MTVALPTDLQDHVQRARRFAALSGPFDPTDVFKVLAELPEGDVDSLVTIAAQLARACDTRYGDDGRAWLMRGTEREWELGELVKTDGLTAAIEWRRELSRDPGAGDLAPYQATDDLLQALLGEPFFDEAGIRSRIDAGGPREELERIALALDRAGRTAPAHGLLNTVNATLSLLETEARNRVLLDQGFFGRQPEKGQIAAWISAPIASRPIRALFISGLPGIGKSTLLDEAVREAGARTPHWLVARLDFDRAGLDVQDRIGLTLELARQIAAQLGDQATTLREARLAAAGTTPSDTSSIKGEGRERIPTALAQTLGSVMQASGRPLLLILDTLELLRGRGETHPERLFDWLDQLTGFSIGPMAVLAAGRGDALDSAPSRIGARVDLRGLDDADSDRVLQQQGAPASSFAEIRELAKGSPLVLRLGARVVLSAGPDGLSKAKGKQDLAAAYLYRFLLSRIDDKTMKQLAHPGLVVRRINAEVIGEVLGPQLDIGRIDPLAAARYFDILSSHHWLVEPDPMAPGFVKHRADIRMVLLPLLYQASPARCARIDRAASKWFAKRPEPWCAVESAYHRLQLMRREPGQPAIDPAVLQLFDEDTIAELPPIAQDVVRRGRGERSTQFRALDGAPSRSSVDPGAAKDIEVLIEKGDWIEGRYVYDQTFGTALFDPRSRDADVARTFLWRSGRWSEAKRLLDDRDGYGGDDQDLQGLSPQLATARLEMEAEFRFARLVDELRRRPEFADLARSMSSSGIRSELDGGALGFALRRADPNARTSSWRGFDTVGATFATWARELAGQDDAGPAVSFAQRRLHGRIEGLYVRADGQGAEAARLLAVLSPYAGPASTLVRTKNVAPLVAYAEAVDQRLAGLGYLRPAGPDSAGPGAAASAPDAATSASWAGTQPTDPLDGLASVGLVAEWAGAAAFLLRDPDLRLIARSAERWRRTAAGKWSYGPYPFGRRTSWNPALDVTVADRVAELERDHDPVARSRAQLAAWAIDDDTDARALIALLTRRLTPTLSAAGEAAASGGAADAAHVLMSRFVPTAFVPALAMLLAREQLPVERVRNKPQAIHAQS